MTGPEETAGTHPGKGGALRPISAAHKVPSLTVAWGPDQSRLGYRLIPPSGEFDLNRTVAPFELDRQISRTHARLNNAPGNTVTLSDIGSRNGTCVNGARIGATPVLLKPGDVVSVGDTVMLYNEISAIPTVDADVPGLLGIGETMRTLRSTIKRFARAPAPVLILGETGVGKELVAQALAEMGRGTRSRPYLAFNCTATSQHLIDATLFGNERGAYTGADKQREGLFKTAHTGTLFLDEVGELDGDVQVKLLRALQEGEVTPVGSVRPIKVDVRVLSATNRDLVEAVKEGAFRSDLYARLAKLTIRVPPLRDRREDIPLLASALGERFSGRPVAFSPEALTRLMMHSWPLNVRELDGAVTQAVVDWGDRQAPIDLSHDTVLRTEEHARLAADAAPGRELDSPTVEDALRRTQGNMKRAADLLGKDRAQLYRIVKRLGLKADDYRPPKPDNG